MKGVIEALFGAALLTEDNEKLAVIGGEQMRSDTTLVVAGDAKGQLHLIDIDTVVDGKVLAFRDVAAADAYVAADKAREEEWERKVAAQNAAAEAA